MKIKEAITVYLKHLKSLGRSYYTIRGAKYGLWDFVRFLDEERVSCLDDLTGDVLEECRQDLAFRLTAKGKPLSIRSQSQLLGVVKGFTRFLKDKDYLLHDPGGGCEVAEETQKTARDHPQSKGGEKAHGGPGHEDEPGMQKPGHP